jgi:hypothetical protein
VVLILVMLALVALLAFAVWSAWGARRVDFIHQIELGVQTEPVAAEMFDQVIPVLVQDGFAMVAQGGHTTVFERRFFPAWAVMVAIFLFPIGLIALLARGTETVFIVSGDRVLEMHGYCSKVTADFILAVAEDVAAPLTPAY